MALLATTIFSQEHECTSFPFNRKHLLHRVQGIFRANEYWSLSLILLNSIFHSESQTECDPLAMKTTRDI